MSSLFGIGGGGNVGAAGGTFYPYSIDQSLRFNDDDSAYIYWNPTTTSNQKTWTISLWVKRCSLGTSQSIFTVGTSANGFEIRFNTDDTIIVQSRVSSSNRFVHDTDSVFRDVGSWYNIVYMLDTTQATDSNRAKLYVNGTQVSLTAFTTNTQWPVQDQNQRVNFAGDDFQFGISRVASTYTDAYLAEINFIDGTALDATSFGETINGIWVPKAYSGSYGTNGFYLTFEGTGTATTTQGTTAQTNIGDDQAGAGNNFTVSGLVASDVMSGESPTNNFATLNSTANFTPATLTEGNLKATPTSSSDKRHHSTFPISSGKWYCEIRIVSTGTRNQIGFWSTENTASASVPTNYAYLGVGNSSNATSGTFNGTAFTASAGDILTYAFDADDGKLYFGRNAAPTIGATADFTGLASDTYVLGQRETGTLNTTNHFNFGQDSTFAGAITAGGNADDNGYGDFAYAPPSGFLAMCSANLPEPAIGPNSDTTSDENFNTVLYTGTGAAQSITGVGFGSAPDFTWIKSRSSAYNNVLWDTVRGATKQLITNTYDAESTQAQGLTSFDSDGFTLGTNGNLNNNGTTYASWNWKAGGTANTFNVDGTGYASMTAAGLADGDIALTGLSVNRTAGFSIGTYTGIGAAGPSTIAHGLGKQVQLVMVKGINNSNYSFAVYTRAGDADGSTFMNTGGQVGGTPAATSGLFTQDAFGSGSGTFDDSFFSIGGPNNYTSQTYNYLFYAFADVEGYLKHGKYVGNGSADGTYVALNFSPAWVLIKKSSGADGWSIYDSAREPINVMDTRLSANLADAEVSGSNIALDFLSNGFKLRGTGSTINSLNETYIYLAIGEAPSKYSNAR